MNEEIAESSKAIQEVAKTSGKAIDCVRAFCGFITQYTAGSIQEACGIFEDKLKYARWENQGRLMKKAQYFLKEQGLEIPDKSIPFKLAVPLLQAASLEDNDYLQDMWAILLVNSATQSNEVELQRMYIDILERLSAFDAKILHTIYLIPYEEALHKMIIVSWLPDKIEFYEKGKERSAYPQPSEEVKLSLLNLDRLNCISVCRSMGGGQLFEAVNQTLLGKNFIDACTLKKTDNKTMQRMLSHR